MESINLKIGLVKLIEQDVCLIHIGNDKDTGRRVRSYLAWLKGYWQAERPV